VDLIRIVGKGYLVMPSTSQAQHKFMAWASSSPENAAKAGIAQEKAQEFVSADKGWKRLAKRKDKKHGKT
jgi:hypothetical protein